MHDLPVVLYLQDASADVHAGVRVLVKQPSKAWSVEGLVGAMLVPSRSDGFHLMSLLSQSKQAKLWASSFIRMTS